MNDTIFALSSGAGRAGVAVIRVSGPAAGQALAALSGRPPPAPRRGALRHLVDPATGERLDQALVLWFPEGGSFTGEASVEFQVHGGRAVVQGVLAALSAIPGLRPADPGEFTRRAFMRGRLDLAQVEALGDLITADTAVQRRQAMRGLEGALGLRVEGWRSALLEIRALIAAEIDFSDEGDVGEQASRGIDSSLKRLLDDLTQVLAGARAGRIVSDGLRVAIVGRPNSGKSTLLNVLSGTDAAIVSEHAGTTRDVIEVRVDWDGFPVVLTDTAGLRETADPVEKIGVARALDRLRNADVILHLDAEGDWGTLAGDDVAERSIRIRTKLDRPGGERAGAEVGISALTGEGLDELRRLILAAFDRLGAPVESAIVVNERQVRALEAAVAASRRALVVPHDHIELRDHEVRSIEASLDHLIGRAGVEEVLGAVFSRFCIGK